MFGMELVIEAKSEKFDDNDPRWLEQVQELHKDLQSEVGDVRKKVTPVEGGKGGIEAIILALGSAGAFSALVQIVKAWLNKDRTRVINVSVKDGDKEKTVTVSGANISEELFKSAFGKAATEFKGD